LVAKVIKLSQCKYMKMGILALIGAALLLAAGNSIAQDAQFREFRSATGKSISAKVVSHKGDGKVKLELVDGKKSTIAIDRFSVDDQKYLKEWVEKHPPALNYAFNYEVEEERGKTERNRQSYVKSKTEQRAYEVKITNMSRDTVSDLTVKYQMFMHNGSDGSGYIGTSQEGRFLQTDTVELPADIDYNHTRTFVTKTFKIDSEVTNYYYNDRSRKDEMEGIIIRVFDKAGTMIDEYSSPAAERAKHKWLENGKPASKRPTPKPRPSPGVKID
jgi:hypothetical protein